jgi:hypothetical protein
MPPAVLRLRLSAAFLVAGALAGCGHPAAPAAPPSRTADGLVVTLTSGADAHVGDNTFSVTLTDAQTRAPIGNANVTAKPQMLAPQMPGVGTSGRAQGNGLYTLPVRLAVATRYDLSLTVERPGHPVAQVSFPIEAAQ